MFLRSDLWLLFVLLSTPVLAQVPGAAPAPGTPTPVPNTPFSILGNSTQWHFEVVSKDHVRAVGQVDLEAGPMTRFFADEIDIFTDPTLRLVAKGNVVFDSPQGRISAEEVE